jgi:hypothetical protein
MPEQTENEAAPERRPTGAPRPANCRKYARARFAEALPEIMDKLLAEALAGNVAPWKVLIELTGLDTPDPPPRLRRKKEKTLEQILLAQWRQDEEDEAVRLAEQANAARDGSRVQAGVSGA